MIDLSKRVVASEWMDDPQRSYEEMAETFYQIALLNRMTRAYRPTLQALNFFWKRHLTLSHPWEPLRILDIGSGYGDFLRVIGRWADRHGRKVALTGIDFNPWAEKAARSATPSKMKIEILTRNIFEFEPAQKYHVILHSLFTHHLSDTEIVRVLQWMTEHSLYGWFISDLHRHPFPYYFSKIFLSLLRFNRFVVHDGPLSFARAFTRQDWKRFLGEAKLDPNKITLRSFLFFRYGVRYEA